MHDQELLFKKTEKELRDRIKHLEHELEKAKYIEQPSVNDSEDYKKLKKKYEHLKEDHLKCGNTIHELKSTIIALQERLSEL